MPSSARKTRTIDFISYKAAAPNTSTLSLHDALPIFDASVRYLAWDLGPKDIRVNAVSAGPVRTLAARSIAGFPTMEAIVEERAPLHRHIAAEIGRAHV